MSVTITGVNFTTLSPYRAQPTAYPVQGSDEIYLLPSGAKFRVTLENSFIAYPTVPQFINLFPKLIGVGKKLWPWQKILNTILNTWFNIGINNKDPEINCSFSVDVLGDIYAYYLSPLMIEIRLWKNEGIYYIEIVVPYDRRDGYYYNIVRSAIGLT
jgi:hypothetical protein